ncbi:pyridoxamine 5'-phosphate oxidase [Proteus mirabilis]|uniref:Pyridoxamine 5'-phosphate oxidase n=1 Tax=Proteus mirabilis TaxID=584 RepID=A0A2X2DUU9_PROMI|nr:pyridoxamine 5'-phosphate oxidase [Proteus mirabilis]
MKMDNLINVLCCLKHFDEKGLVFYTNLGSRKASHLEHNQRVSLLFPWYPLERQVCFLGKAEKLSAFEVVKYFHSRPKDSQIAAWASKTIFSHFCPWGA